MLRINEDNSIYATRGDSWKIALNIEADGWMLKLCEGDVIRFTVYEKGNTSKIFLQKEFVYDGNEGSYESDDETIDVTIGLEFTPEETKIGEVISKPKDYWYEVEHLFKYYGDTVEAVTTLIGYDENGAKVLKLFPEANYEE